MRISKIGTVPMAQNTINSIKAKFHLDAKGLNCKIIPSRITNLKGKTYSDYGKIHQQNIFAMLGYFCVFFYRRCVDCRSNA